ncbi:MAG: hypothetical protein RLP12_15515, partial [Ekhidna sp.]
VGNGTVTIFEVDEVDIADESFSFNQNIAIPADVVLGAHTLEVTVEDASGNVSSSSVNLEAYPVYTDGETTILVESVPDQVSDYTGDNTIYMVGTHQETEWTVDTGSDPLSIYTDSEGTVTFYHQIPNTGAEFKFVRGLVWEKVQKDENGAELVGNNTVEADAKKATFTIGSWRDYNPEVSNNSNGTIISIDGSLVSDTHTVSGNIQPAITTQAAISSVAYAVVDEDDSEVASGTVTIDGNGNFSEDIDVSAYALGSYKVVLSATDAEGNSGREDEVLNLVEFPCDDSGEEAVASNMTRIIVNVAATSDDIYATGNFDGDIWGTVDDQYKLTKLSDGCYYIDLALTSGQIVQFFRYNEGYSDWWRGQATNTAGSDATANYNVDADSDGSTIKLYYAYWREEPSN